MRLLQNMVRKVKVLVDDGISAIGCSMHHDANNKECLNRDGGHYDVVLKLGNYDLELTAVEARRLAEKLNERADRAESLDDNRNEYLAKVANMESL